jgi:integrase
VRGSIETLPSGSLRVIVYSGVDPVTKKEKKLTAVIPAGPDAPRLAEEARTRLLNQVDERRHTRTRATVNQLLDRHFELSNAQESTVDDYRALANNHIRPDLGALPIGRITGEALDSFYKILRTCRTRCGGRKHVVHRAQIEHECDGRCRPHECSPLADGTVRKIHAILSGAGKRAVRWGWVGVNPFELAEPIPTPRPDPQPPTSAQAVVIINEAWLDPDWGMLIWFAMTTGARRGELCALKWDRIDFVKNVLTVRSSIRQRGGRTWEKDTKTHQQRRITLDAQTMTLLRDFRAYCADRAAIGDMPDDSRIFSNTIDGSTWLKPDSVTQRYSRMCARLGWDMHLHQLRHYSATELITSGVDVRTVAGRLGHGGGGATTLKVYTAWVSEADQRAAGVLSAGMPTPPKILNGVGIRMSAEHDPSQESDPYQHIANDLRGAILCGALAPGVELPKISDIAKRYAVSFGTAQRAVAQLRAAGLVTAGAGRRTVVANPDRASGVADVVDLGSVRRTAK